MASRILAVAVGTVLLATCVDGHAALVFPPSRNANDRWLPNFTNGSSPDTPCTCANGLGDEELELTSTSTGCWTDVGYNYNSHPNNLKIEPAATPDDCCTICQTVDKCAFWTHANGNCYLKDSDEGRQLMHGAVSGGSGVMPPMPPKKVGCDQGLREGAGGQPCLWWSQGCSIGCDVCATAAGGTTPITGSPPHTDKMGFRTRYCNSTFNATLPKEFWTMNIAAVENSINDSYRYNPWRAPGYAPVVDACGQAGGKYKQTPVGGDSAFTTTPIATMGDLGSKVLVKGASGANWTAGSQVVVRWGMRYNHGGGYQYRLCSAKDTLSEECFQKTPLDFVRDKQALVWNNGTRWPIAGMFIDVGTWPKGSTWARNPIPRVNDDNKGLADFAGCPGPSGTSGPRCLQFPAPCPQDTGRLPWSTDGSGQGMCSGDWTLGVIEDTVIIPADLDAGDYVLSWRWDCEETAQIWQNCADVTIQSAVTV